ncbi:MAG TPA: hypothetical protein V6C88_07145 [Chroococcidiopsis sp.]
MNISGVRLKQGYGVVGSVLLAIATTACSAAPTAPPLDSSSSVAVSPQPTPSASTPSSPSPTVSPSPPQSTDNATLQQEAVALIHDYYRAIARRDYAHAYADWEGDGSASQQSFEQFRQGFANTASVAVEVGTPGQLDGAAGSTYIEIPVTITAVTTSNVPQRFRGSYVLRRVNDVPGSTAEQRQWHIYSATINQVH